MDAMALLCTLHADGPSTLRRLRASGFQCLADLESAKADSISQVLEISAAAARRFMREAVALSQRVDEAPLEVEPRTPGRATAPGGFDSSGPAVLSSRDKRIVDKVLTRWRESDAELQQTTPSAGAVPKTSAGLQPGMIDGLNEDICRSLNEAGVDNLAALSRIDLLPLGASTGLSFSTLRRFQFLARRAVNKPAPEERFSAAERPAFTGAVLAWELEPEDGVQLKASSGRAGSDRDSESRKAAEDAGGPFA